MPRPAASRRRPRAARTAGRHPLDMPIATLLAAGILFVMFPKVLSTLPGLAAMAGLQKVGWMLLALGAAALALRLLAKPAKPPAEAPQPELPPEPQPALQKPARAKAPRAEPAAPSAPVPNTPPATGEAPQRPTAWGLEVFSVIEWRRFEALVEALFAQAGFITRSQSHGADGGVDVWLHSKNQPDGTPVSIVQCKHWSGNKPVGVDKIRELRGVMAAHNVRRGQFACTARYTDAAREFARDNQINLLDGESLLAFIAKQHLQRNET